MDKVLRMISRVAKKNCAQGIIIVEVGGARVSTTKQGEKNKEACLTHKPKDGHQVTDTVLNVPQKCESGKSSFKEGQQVMRGSTHGQKAEA